MSHWLRFALLLSLCTGLFACHPPHPDTASSQQAQVPSEEFEGVVTYKTHLTAKSTLVDEDQLNALYGDTLRWHYRKGSYRWQYNGAGIQDVFYVAQADTEFTQRSGIDTLFTLNIREESRSLDSLHLTGTTRTVLGRSCEDLILQVGRTRHIYCIDKQLLIRADHYRGFQYGFLEKRYALGSGAYLAYSYESPIFMIEREAVRIEERSLEAKSFDVPPWPRAALLR